MILAQAPRRVAHVPAGVRLGLVSAGGAHSLALPLVGRCPLHWVEARAPGRHPQREVRPNKRGDVSTACHRQAVAPVSGACYSWGFGGYGRLGHADQAPQLQPKRLAALAAPPQRRRVTLASAGAAHSLLLDATGQLLSCGYGACGRLGHGDERTKLIPTQVAALRAVAIVDAAAGELHSVALSVAGAVYSWGRAFGHGDERTRCLPARVSALAGVEVCEVAAGDGHVVVRSRVGDVYTFGLGAEGQLGHGEGVKELSLPRRVELLD